MDDKIAAGIISRQLQAHAEHYQTAKEDMADAKKRFLAGVRDPDHFGRNTALTEKGKWRISIHYQFFTNGFVIAAFTFSPQPRGHLRGYSHSHGYSVLYRKQGDAWIPMPKTPVHGG